MDKFKVGGVIECIDVEGYAYITLGKEYVVESLWGGSENHPTLINDTGEECGMCNSRFKLATQTEAERRGAKFGVTGVIKSTGDRVVFVKERNGFWRVFDEIGADYDLKPYEIRLDHEPEFVAWSEAPEHLRYDASRVYCDGKPVKWIADPEGSAHRVVYVQDNGVMEFFPDRLTVKL